MLAIIFGAGASRDLGSRWHDLGLPLAAELFSESYAGVLGDSDYERARPLLPELRRAGASVEQALEKIWDEAKEVDALVPQLEAVRYYLRRLITDRQREVLRATQDKATNYVVLLRQVERWRSRAGSHERVLLATFNYDTLIEEALASNLGLRLARATRIDEYVSDERYWLIKFHGSITWSLALHVPSGTPPPRSDWDFIERASELKSAGRVVTAAEQLQPDFGWGAALSIPLATKTESDFLLPLTHLQLFESAVPQLTQLLIIGWRGEEAHFWNLWKAHRPSELQRILVVGAKGGPLAAVKLGQELGLPLGQIDVFRGSLSEFVDSGEFQPFIEGSKRWPYGEAATWAQPFSD